MIELKCFVCRFADYDGSNRHIVLSGSVPHPFSITLFEEYMYWSDWNLKNVEKANRFTGENRVVLTNTTHRPMDIKMYHQLRQKPGETNLLSQITRHINKYITLRFIMS